MLRGEGHVTADGRLFGRAQVLRGTAVTMVPSTVHPEAPAPATDGLRHRCRNPHCGLKLKRPVDNPRDAFCCRACFERFYRSRCLVCERPIERKTKRRQICNRSKCRHEFQRHRERFFSTRYQTSVLGHNGVGSAHSTGLKTGSKVGRPFRLVAGPALSSTSLRLAGLPLIPELAARLERINGNLADQLRKAKVAVARRAQLKRHHPPVNVLGGYHFLDAPVIDLSPAEDLPVVRSRWAPTGEGIAPPIPEFLLRRAPVPAISQRRRPCRLTNPKSFSSHTASTATPSCRRLPRLRSSSTAATKKSLVSATGRASRSGPTSGPASR